MRILSLAAWVVATTMAARGPVAGQTPDAPDRATPPLARACDEANALRRVRPRDAMADMLLQFGSGHSQTFRELLASLCRSDVIVYVQVRHDAGHAMNGSLRFIGASSGIRWVMATIEPGTSRPGDVLRSRIALTALLGHELQHAREVSEAPSIQATADFDSHFRTMGIKVRENAFDTHAARRAGHAVNDELRCGLTCR